MSSTARQEFTGVWQRVTAALRRPLVTLVGRLSAPRRSRLQHVIESQIVPRLVLADGLAGRHGFAPHGEAWEPTRDDVEELTRLLLEHDSGVAIAYVGVLAAKGAPATSLWLGLLAPTARQLSSLSADGELEPARVVRAQARLREVLQAVDREPSSGFGGNAVVEPSAGA
jgi:hypothetical protein